jgi:hypothetical protein
MNVLEKEIKKKCSYFVVRSVHILLVYMLQMKQFYKISKPRI